MKDEEIYAIAEVLTFENFHKLIKRWLLLNIKKLSFREGSLILGFCMECINAGNESEIEALRSHAANAEIVGAYALQNAKLNMLEKVLPHVDKFKDSSFCNYQEWFYGRLEKMRQFKEGRKI